MLESPSLDIVALIVPLNLGVIRVGIDGLVDQVEGKSVFISLKQLIVY